MLRVVMWRVITASIVVYHVSGMVDKCPTWVSCRSTVDRHSCPRGTYFRENVKSLGCCPDCVQLKGLTEACEKPEECANGLTCDEKRKLCLPDKKQYCEEYKRGDEVWTATKYWKPDCQPNGKFAPKQCKGERLTGRCFCYSEDGRRIFGEMDWTEAENMTCACSRLMDNLRREGITASYHCDEAGNFEFLQCNDKVCWCANEKTGKPYTVVVPETMVTALPCYEEKTFGFQYLRQCDSITVNSERAVGLLADHGIISPLLPTIRCNYDGSFARLQRSGTNMYCIYKNNLTLTYPMAPTKTCNCVYDRFVAEKVKQKEFHFECLNYGDYDDKVFIGDEKINIDQDGIPIYNRSHEVESAS